MAGVLTDGIYDPLTELFGYFIQEKFAKPMHLELITFVGHVDTVCDVIESS